MLNSIGNGFVYFYHRKLNSMYLFLAFFFSFLQGTDAPSAMQVDDFIQALNKMNYTHTHAIMIDMSVPSDEQRLYVINLSSKTCEYKTYVAHGKGSGRGAQATFFSDEPGSYCTALGMYKVGKNYNGKHGNSYELMGLEKSNANAESRAIVIHSAWYAEEDFIKKNNRCGNSWGCPAVSPDALKKLQPYLTEGTVIWIYK